MKKDNTQSQTPRKRSQTKMAPRPLQLICAVIVFAVGCALMVAGFLVPPVGEIHPSVLVGFGEGLTFTGAVFGMRYHYKYGSK